MSVCLSLCLSVSLSVCLFVCLSLSPLPLSHSLTYNRPSPSFGQLPSHLHADNTETTAGTVVTFTCDTGYMIVGDGQLTCQDSGDWDHNVPTCEEGMMRICDPVVTHPPLPTPPLSLSVSPLPLPPPLSVSVSPSPSPSLSHFPSTAKCEPLQLPSHLHADDTNIDIGTLVSFTCQTGYRITGSKQITCKENGEWSDRVPTCTESKMEI